MMVKVIAMATRQISVTLEEDLVRFLDETTNNRSAAISEALEQWRDLQWQRRLSAAYAELNEAARSAVTVMRGAGGGRGRGAGGGCGSGGGGRVTITAGHLCTWPRNPLLQDSRRRPAVVLSETFAGRATALVVPLTSDLSGALLPLPVPIAATRDTGLERPGLALCDQITCLMLSLLSEPFGRVDEDLLRRVRRAGALALGLRPSDLRAGG
jgi:mRNA-degrading endonuclease toxin of MazEF toxin-antitoxin module